MTERGEISSLGLYTCGRLLEKWTDEGKTRKSISASKVVDEMSAVAAEYGYHVDAVEICKEDYEYVSEALDMDIKWCDIVECETDKKY